MSLTTTPSRCSCQSCGFTLSASEFSRGDGLALSNPEDYQTNGRWPSNVVTFSFATGGQAGRTTMSADFSQTFRQLYRAALDRWTEVANIQFVEVADSASTNIRLGMREIDGASGTVGQTFSFRLGTSLTRADVYLDTAEPWGLGFRQSPDTQVQFYSTALHEIGHAIGIAHSAFSSAIMYASYVPSVLDLSTDDIQAAQSLYGAAAANNRIYRFYNTATGTHFFTASLDERNTVRQQVAGFNYEGAVFSAATAGAAGSLQVYRFYNRATGTHFFTGSAAERDAVRSGIPQFTYEGVAYNAYSTAVAGSVGLHRFYNTANGTHFYTASAAERDTVAATLPSYRYEGVAYYVAA